MDVRVLKYFLAVAREGNFTVAANALHITQPTLSRQIMELEEELGKPLFVREGRSISLSEHGLMLQKRAEDIVALMERTESEIRADDDTITGEITIAGAEAESTRIVVQEMQKLKQEYPGIHITISSKARASVLEKLDRGLLDFGIVMGRVDSPRFDSLLLPRPEPFGILVPAEHPLASQSSVSPADLSGLPLLFPTGMEDVAQFRSWYAVSARQSEKKDRNTAETGTGKDASKDATKTRDTHRSSRKKQSSASLDDLNIVGHYSLFYYAEMMVQEGIGIALCLGDMLSAYSEEHLRFIPLAPVLHSELYFVWRKYARLGKAASALLDRMLDVCADET